MDINKMIDMAKALANRLEFLTRREKEVSADIQETGRRVDQEAIRLKEEVERALDQYVRAEKDAAEAVFSSVKSVANDDSMVQLTCYSQTDEFEKEGLEANRVAFRELLNDIERICAEMNAINFDKLDPPVSYSVDYKNYAVLEIENGKTFYSPKRRKEKTELCDDYCNRLGEMLAMAGARLNAIERCYRAEMDVDSYVKEVRNHAETVKDQYAREKKKQLNDLIERQLSGNDEAINLNALEQAEADGAKFEPDHNYGSQEFSKKIKLGDLKLTYADKYQISQYSRFLECNPRLNKRVGKGTIDGPWILDLQEKGNILIDANSTDGRVSQQVSAFIHQFIQSFLLKQPACRVNLCLIDCNDQCKFNRYAQLKNMNLNALFKGIIRNEKQIDDVVSDMENIMFDIGDNQLSAQNVADIFEYNEIAGESPLSMHLLVLLDFPGKYSLETISHIQKIVGNGNASGIYTLIIRNKADVPDFGSRKGTYEAAIKDIENKCICLRENYDGFLLEENQTVKPLSTLPIEKFVEKVLPVLQESAKQQKQTTIPLDAMFDESDRYCEAIQDPFHASDTIEIPVGKNGGEVYSLKFDTTGVGNPHALVIGGTGSGKSNLLHAIILSGVYRYSPRDLQLYLIDFKDGDEFKFYEAEKVINDQLPHVALAGLSREPEDGVAILTNIRRIMHERGDLFRRNNVQNIRAYNEAVGVAHRIPRILVIIDEIQILFENDERLGQRALSVLSELFKKGRSFGISILWASQNVPKAVGGDFRDKVLSQIGNRISLKLNNVDDAEVLDIPKEKVRALNRPEKGLGIIYDGRDYVEFRVAYAEQKDRRLRFVHQINERWEKETETFTDRKQMFVVGDDEKPVAEQGPGCFRENVARVRSPKSRECYQLCLGQDYICGDPYQISVMSRASGENVWFAGKDMGVVRDMMGYAALSVAMENYTNSDMTDTEKKMYFFNGEFANQANDLFSALPEKLGTMAVQLNDVHTFAEAMVELYKLRKQRYEDMGQTHAPIYVFAHSMQILGELFADPKKYSVAEQEKPATTSEIGGYGVPSGGGYGVPSGYSVPSGGGYGMPGSYGGSGTAETRLTFAEIMQELFRRGPDAGIHFVISFNEPTAIPELRNEIRGFTHKIVIMGVNKDAVSSTTDNYMFSECVPNKPGVAFHYSGNEMSKFKMYRYDHDVNSAWFSAVLDSYQS